MAPQRELRLQHLATAAQAAGLLLTEPQATAALDTWVGAAVVVVPYKSLQLTD
jgi:hypothetical protein